MALNDLPIVSFRGLRDAFQASYAKLEDTLTSSGYEIATAEEDAVDIAGRITELSEALQAIESSERHPGVMVSVRHQAASLLQTYLAQQEISPEKLREAESGGYEAQFDPNDWFGWAGSFFTWWKKINPHKFLDAGPIPETIGNSVRVALLSDWGTGLYGAPVCANSIAQDASGFGLVMHLGDVYYSGDEKEIEKRLLSEWPSVPNAVNRALNGNHEMYTGGKAYFEIALPSFQQKASYFALQNDHWLLVALDSAYEDHDLAAPQIDWLNGLLKQAENRKTILFCHHQPYSLFEKQGPRLAAKLAPILLQKRVFAWYWGHEHRCALYEPHSAWGFRGRCIGHSGFPEFRESFLGPTPPKSVWKQFPSKNLVPGALVLDGPNPHIKGHENEYGPHGYVVLEFSDQNMEELICDADGTVLRREALA